MFQRVTNTDLLEVDMVVVGGGETDHHLPTVDTGVLEPESFQMSREPEDHQAVQIIYIEYFPLGLGVHPPKELVANLVLIGCSGFHRDGVLKGHRFGIYSP